MNLNEPSRDEPGRILILRPDHLGDLILFSGALGHIRNRWPSAHITLCVRSYGMALFANCPHVDRLQAYETLIPFGKVNWPSWLSGRWFEMLVSTIAPSWKYDLAILPMIAPWVNHHRILQLLPVRERVGVSGNVENQTAGDDLYYRRIYSRQMNSSILSWNTPELETNRLFLKFLGIKMADEDLWPEFWTRDQDRDAARELLGAPRKKFRLGIAPGAVSPPGKKLSTEWYVETLRQAQLDDTEIVLLGGKSEVELCAEIAFGLNLSDERYPVKNLAGTTKVLELVECIRACDFLLCPDAAPLHIAAALRKPVVGVMGGGHFGRFYPWGDLALSRVVNKLMDCYGCNWECKYEAIRCVQEILPSDAARELQGLLGNLLKDSKTLTFQSK